jgi:putative transposase
VQWTKAEEKYRHCSHLENLIQFGVENFNPRSLYEEKQVQRRPDPWRVEGRRVGFACGAGWRQHGISVATYYQWKSKYAGMSGQELKRVKELEAENSKLKRMYAELALENTAIKDVLSRKL